MLCVDIGDGQRPSKEVKDWGAAQFEDVFKIGVGQFDIALVQVTKWLMPRWSNHPLVLIFDGIWKEGVVFKTGEHRRNP